MEQFTTVNTKPCLYTNLNLYNNTTCGKGVTAPRFASTPFQSAFPRDNNFNNTYNRNCCDPYDRLGKSNSNTFSEIEYEYKNMIRTKKY